MAAVAHPPSPRQAVYDRYRLTTPTARQVEGFTRAHMRQAYGAQLRTHLRALGYTDHPVQVTDPSVLEHLGTVAHRVATTIQRTYNGMLDRVLRAVPGDAGQAAYHAAAEGFNEDAKTYNRAVLVPWTLGIARHQATADFFETNGIEATWHLAHPLDATSCARCVDLVARAGADGASHETMRANPMPLHRRCRGSQWLMGQVDEATLPDPEDLWVGGAMGRTVATKAWEPAKHPRGQHGHFTHVEEGTAAHEHHADPLEPPGYHTPTAEQRTALARLRHVMHGPPGAADPTRDRPRPEEPSGLEHPMVSYESDFQTRYTPAQQQRFLDHLAGLGLSREILAANFEHIYSPIPRDQMFARTYFSVTHRWARSTAASYGMATERLAAIAAALSPRRPWVILDDSGLVDNIHAAERLLDYHDDNPTIRITHAQAAEYNASAARKSGGGASIRRDIASDGAMAAGTYAMADLSPMKAAHLARAAGYLIAGQGGWAQVGHAIALARGASIDDTLRGPKVRSFYNNIVRPEVTNGSAIDTHVLRAALDHSTVTVNGKRIDARRWERLDTDNRFDRLLRISGKGALPGGYAFMADLMRELGARHGMRPHEYQSMLWLMSKYHYLGENPDPMILHTKAGGWDPSKHPHGVHGHWASVAHGATEHHDDFHIPEETKADRNWGRLQESVRGDYAEHSRVELEREYRDQREAIPLEHGFRQRMTYAAAEEVRNEAARRGLSFDAAGRLHAHGDAAREAVHVSMDTATFRPTRPVQERPTPEGERQALQDWLDHAASRGGQQQWDGQTRASATDAAIELDRINARAVADAGGGATEERQMAHEFFTAWASSPMSDDGQDVQVAAADLFALPLHDVRASQMSGPGSPADAFVRGQYAHTQAVLGAEGTDHVTLYRGMSADTPPDGLGHLDPARGTWTEASLASRPLSSWTSSFAMAHAFARDMSSGAYGYVYAMSVPRERIFSTTYTGMGALTELEYVLLGGTDRVGVTRIAKRGQ